MNRSSCRVGKRGTTFGFFADVTVPLQAIWSVIHTGLPPAARTIFLVTSPTTLMSRFGRSECSPGRIRDREDVGAGDVEGRPVRRQLSDGAARRLDDHERVVRVERLEPLGRAHEAFRPEPVGAPERVAWLVDALVRAEPGMILQRGRDRREHLLPGRRLLSCRPRRQVRQLAEVEPAVEAGCRGGVELCALRGDLLGELPGAPVAAARADEGRARVGKLLQAVLAARGLAAERRPVRKPEREDFRAADAQRSGRSVDRDAAHD